jgi:NTP pyrophosphatase (non-canonical NTP hydrolase)
MNAQEIVAANVAARGYRDGWALGQLAARQIAKLTEELAELAKAIDGNMVWLDTLEDAGRQARLAFDYAPAWADVKLIRNVAEDELPDVAVPLFVLADILSMDIVQAAIDKSSADVARGVR